MVTNSLVTSIDSALNVFSSWAELRVLFHLESVPEGCSGCSGQLDRARAAHRGGSKGEFKVNLVPKEEIGRAHTRGAEPADYAQAGAR